MRFRKKKGQSIYSLLSKSQRSTKYISLFDQFPQPLIELEGNNILFANKEAQSLLSLSSGQFPLELDKVFVHPTIPENQPEFILHLLADNSLINLKQIYSESEKNSFYQLQILKRKTDISLTTIATNLDTPLKLMIENSNEGICIFNEEGRIVTWNQALSDLYNVPESNYLHAFIWDFEYDFLPQDQKNKKSKAAIEKRIQEYLNQVEKTTSSGFREEEIDQGLRYIQHQIFPIKTSQGYIYIRINFDVSESKATEEELKRHRIYLEELIDKRTLELQKSKTRLQLVLQSVPIAFYSYESKERQNLWHSEQIENLTGFKGSDFVHDTNLWPSRINKEDLAKVADTFNNLKPNVRVACEYRWKNALNEEIWIYDQAVKIEASANYPEQVVGCFIDISDRKEAEVSIRESEWNYREIFNSSSDAIFIHNSSTGIVEDVNETALAMYRVSYDQMLNKPIDNFLSDNKKYSKEVAIKNIEQALLKGSHQFEWYARRGDNTLFWVDVILKTVILNGEAKVMAVVRDINEKKITEERIQSQLAFEKLILNISSRFVNITSDEVDGGIDEAFSDLCKFSKTTTGYLFLYNQKKQSISLTNLWQTSSSQINKSKLQNLPLQNVSWHVKQIVNNKVVTITDLKDLPAEANHLKEILSKQNVHSFIDVPLIYQNNVIGFLGMADVNSGHKLKDDEVSLLRIAGQIFINAIKQKESLDTIYESEQTHREIYNATSEAIIILDIDSGKFIDVNETMLQMFGFTYTEAIEKRFKDLSTGKKVFTPAKLEKLIDRMLANGPQVSTWQAHRKDGSILWVEMTLKQAGIRGERRALTVLRDVTERKISAESLKKNEEKYRLLVESQTDLIVKIDPEGRFLFVSKTYCETFGKTEEDLIGKTFMPLVHDDDKELTSKAMEKLYTPPYTCYIEQRALTKIGWRWIAWNDTAILDKNNQVKEIIGVGRDISYQKGVEEALRRSEDRFRSIVQHLSDIVFICDRESKIIYDTPTIKTLLGYEEGDLIGQKLLSFIDDEDTAYAERKFTSLLSDKNNTLSMEFRIRHISGSNLPVEVIAINLLDHPSINGVVVTLRDISERKMTDKKILDAVIKTEEQERERFAKNLHDDLGPLLSSIKLYLSSLSTTNTKQKQEYIITQLQEVVKEAITTTKEVSNDLSPHILINYGLISAIENFTRKIPQNIKVNFERNILTERYSNSIENSFYRIIKELINNTLKHANATQINIKLSEDDQELVLAYSDNGKEKDIKAKIESNSSGMGISNIISRVKSLNGKYEFPYISKGGFSFNITIPIHQPMD